MTKEEADKLVFGDRDRVVDEKMADTAKLSPSAYYGQRLEGAIVQTTDGDVPVTFTPERIVPREEYGRLIVEIKKKIRGGIAISAKELYILMRSRADMEDQVKTGPTKHTVKLLRQVADLSIREGVEKMSDIAARLGITPAALSMSITRYPDVYSKAIQEVLATMSAEDTAVNQVVRFRALRQMRKTALAAPGVVDEVMSDPDQPGGVRLKAADVALKSFGIGERQDKDSPVINLSADKIQIAQQIMNEEGHNVIDSPDTEVIDACEVPTEGSYLERGSGEDDPEEPGGTE